jgi:hypothetical protein
MSFFKNREQEVKQALSGDGYQWERGGYKEGRVNIVEILCTHVRKWKNETC